MILGTYNLPGAITFLGLTLALAAAIFSYRQQLPAAMICLIYSGICDLFDGWVARRFNRSAAEKTFGLQIDSLADMAAFGFVPPMILLHSGFDQGPDFILFGLYVSTAAMRLAHFNQARTGARQPMGTYTGLPVTYAALVFPLLMLLSGVLDPKAFQGTLRTAVAAMALMFVLRVPIPKPRGKAYAFFTALAVGLTLAWLVKN